MEHTSVENEAVSRNLFDDIAAGDSNQGTSNNFGQPEEEPVQQQSLEEPVTEQAAAEPVIEQPDGQGEVAQEPVQQEVAEQKSQKDLNFEILREKNERLKLENAAALNRVRQYEEQAMQQQQANLQQVNLQQAPPPQQQSYKPFEGSDDDLIEGRHVKGLYDQQKAMREDLAAYKQQLKVSSDEARFRTQYTDVDKVLSPDNIAKLGREQPELAKALSSTNDFYTQAVSTYKMIKKLGIYAEDNYAADRALAQQNIQKPKPLASVSPQRGNSPLSMASSFSNGDASKEALDMAYKEMEKFRKGYL